MVIKQWVRRAPGGLPSTRFATVLDQGMSALSNLLLAVLVARSATAEDFGLYGVGTAIYWIALGSLRATGSEALAVLPQGLRRSPREDARLVVSSSVYLIALTSTVCIIVGLLFQDASSLLLTFSLVMPFALVQDVYRSISLAQQNSRLALLSDILWVFVLVSFIALEALGASLDIPHMPIVAWGIGAALSATYLVGRTQVFWSPRQTLLFWFQNGKVCARFWVEFASGFGSMQLVYFGVAAYASLRDVGALRGAYTVLGPVGVVLTGLLTAAIPDVSKTLHNLGKVAFRNRVLSYSATALGGMGLLGGAYIMFGDSFGTLVLGQSWPGAEALILPVFLATLANGLAIGPRAGCRALSADGRGAITRAIFAPLTAISSTVGLLIWGIGGAAWGIAVGAALNAIVALIQYLNLYQRYAKSCADGRTG